MGKNSVFKNYNFDNFKNLEILRSKTDFFNFPQAITFDKFMIANKNFQHMFYTGNTRGKQRTKKS